MHSEARRGISEGGAIVQTSLPRRWTRNRPPADSIWSRIVEKERLASVAEIRCSRTLADGLSLSDFIDTYLIISTHWCESRASHWHRARRGRYDKRTLED